MGEFINTFENGMSSDFDPVFQPKGTYPYMKNCSPISQDGRNYAIKDCLGNTLVFTLNVPYSGTYATSGTPPTPLAFISFPDKLVVLMTNLTSGGYGEIGVIRYLPYGEGVQPMSVTGEYNAGYVPLYHHADLNFGTNFAIEGFGLPENDITERIYWTDTNDEPKVFNTANPIFSTYIATGSLVVGTQYMVIEGAVTHNGTPYGPGLGNVFTAVNANYTALTGTAPTPKVIEYYNYELLAWTPDKLTGNMVLDSFGDGFVNCGNKQFFYQLSLEDGSFVTSWSYGSGLIPVLLDTAEVSPGGSNEYYGGGTETVLVNSGRSVKVKISGIDTRYAYITLACAEYDQLIDTPRQVVIVAKTAITSDEMTLEYTGVSLGALTISEITTFPVDIYKCKTIATNKNYLLAGNITERLAVELDLDVSGVTISSFEYPLVFGRNINTNTYGQEETEVNTNATPGTTSIYPWSRWQVVSGGSIQYPAGSGPTYGPGEAFVGLVGSTTYSVTEGAPVIRPCVIINKYNNQSTSARTENVTLLGGNGSNNAYWDYREPTVAQLCKSYWSNEPYRPGLLLWDLKGKPMYVIPLPDFTFPSLNDKGGIIVDDGTTYAFNPSGLQIDDLFISDEILDQISGFSIVRAERTNPRIITQGLVTQATVSGGVYRPAAYNIPAYSNGPLADRLYVYLSPDIMCEADLKGSVGVVGDSMEEGCWVSPYMYGGTNPNRVVFTASSNQNDFVMCRLVEQLASDNDSPRSIEISYWSAITDGESKQVPDGSGTNITFNNDMLMSGSGPTPTSGAALSNYFAVGGQKIVFGSAADFKYYPNSATDFTALTGTAATDSYKILMNYVKPGGGDYGNVEDTVYISTGHFQPINSTVRSETAVTGGCQFDGIEVFGGDCYTIQADYGYGLWDYDHNAGANTYSYLWFFPCESNSNYYFRRARKCAVDGMGFAALASLANQVIWADSNGTVQLEGFQYNKAYSSEGQSFQFPGIPANYVSNNLFKTRIRFAGPKVNGEVIDSFRTFLTLDFQDIDVRGGEINKLGIKGAYIIAWQNKQTTTIPILERQLVSGLSGSATSLGTGGVVDRFDAISTYYGTQHKWSVIEMPDGYAWFDMRRKAFMIFDAGIAEMSLIQGLSGFFNEAFVEAVGQTYSAVANSMEDLINPPDFNETCDRPLIGTGITGVFDPKFKMLYMCFKFKRRTSGTASTNADFTIMYYSPKKMFVGFSDWMFNIAHSHNQMLLSSNNPKNLNKFFGSGMTSTVFDVGDVVNGGSGEYICHTINDGVTYSIPPNPSYFSLINQTNQIWVSNQPESLGQATAPDYQYNKIFGRVVNNIISMIVNPKTQNPFTVYAIEQKGNNINVTDVDIENDFDSAADNSIRATDWNYKTIWDSITSNLPLGSAGRLVDRYLKITLTKKNWTTSPTTLVKSVKIIQWLKSVFGERR